MHERLCKQRLSQNEGVFREENPPQALETGEQPQGYHEKDYCTIREVRYMRKQANPAEVLASRLCPPLHNM